MPREKPAYRDNLESILNFLKDKYGDNRHLLLMDDLKEYTGRKYDYCKKNYIPDRKDISAETFARLLS